MAKNKKQQPNPEVKDTVIEQSSELESTLPVSVTETSTEVPVLEVPEPVTAVIPDAEGCNGCVAFEKVVPTLAVEVVNKLPKPLKAEAVQSIYYEDAVTDEANIKTIRFKEVCLGAYFLWDTGERYDIMQKVGKSSALAFEASDGTGFVEKTEVKRNTKVIPVSNTVVLMPANK